MSQQTNRLAAEHRKGFLAHGRIHQEYNSSDGDYKLVFGRAHFLVLPLGKGDTLKTPVGETRRGIQDKASDQRHEHVHHLLSIKELGCSLAGANTIHIDYMIPQRRNSPLDFKQSAQDTVPS